MVAAMNRRPTGLVRYLAAGWATLVIALPAGCARPAHRPVTVGNQATSPASTSSTEDDGRAFDVVGTPGLAGLRGRIIDRRTGAPVGGATVVVAGGGTSELVAISEDDGGFELADLVPGRVTVTVYVDDAVTTRPDQPISLGHVRVIEIRVDTAPAATILKPR